MNRKLFFILLLFPFITKAQVVSDARLWTGVSVSKKINDFEFSFSEELRFDENVSHIDKVFSEIGAKYKIIKGLYTHANYRWSRDNDYETVNYEMNHRIDFGLTYKYKIGKTRLSWRAKYQVTSASPEENSPKILRNKFAANYKFNNKFIPFIAYEFYYQFNDEKVINRTRIAFGTSYKLNDMSSLKFSYMYENKFNVKYLKHNHVYGVSYSIDL